MVAHAFLVSLNLFRSRRRFCSFREWEASKIFIYLLYAKYQTASDLELGGGERDVDRKL